MHGQIDPSIIVPDILDKVVRNVTVTLDRHFPEFHMLYKTPYQIYNDNSHVALRHGEFILISVKFPFTSITHKLRLTPLVWSNMSHTTKVSATVCLVPIV